MGVPSEYYKTNYLQIKNILQIYKKRVAVVSQNGKKKASHFEKQQSPVCPHRLLRNNLPRCRNGLLSQKPCCFRYGNSGLSSFGV